MTDVLEELAIRCETEEASWQLDAAISNAVQNPNGAMWWTRKLDDAVKLSDWILLYASDIGADGLPMVVLGDGSVAPSREAKGIAGGTLALTWCAAALRARAAMAKERLAGDARP